MRVVSVKRRRLLIFFFFIFPFPIPSYILHEKRIIWHGISSIWAGSSIIFSSSFFFSFCHSNPYNFPCTYYSPSCLLLSMYLHFSLAIILLLPLCIHVIYYILYLYYVIYMVDDNGIVFISSVWSIIGSRHKGISGTIFSYNHNYIISYIYVV